MQTHKFVGTMRATVGTALLGVALAGCDKPAPQVTPPEPPAQTAPAPTIPDAPPSEPATPTPAPTPDAPPPTEPSAIPKPASSNEPSVESMLAAIPSSKMGVAVDLRYSFDGEVLPNQPVTVHLAALPRVGGADMKVSVQNAAGLRLAGSPLNVQKASASGVYRQQFSMTRLEGSVEPLRVLVTMQSGEESAFGYFTIPLESGTNAQKQESVKLR
jgi:hypothetical protein